MPRLARGQRGIDQRRSSARVRRREARHRHIMQHRPVIDVAEVVPLYVGALSHTCLHCRASRFPGEPLNCCHNGKVELPPLSPYPEEMEQLITSRENFRVNIRQYNSTFAFASMSANVYQFRTSGPYSFRIHGQVYHRTGTLHPADGELHRYGQIYILEGSQALDSRLQDPNNANCLVDIMGLVGDTLNRINPYAAAYRHMYQVEQELVQTSNVPGEPLPTVTMVIKRGADQRRYNNPQLDEVAAVFVGPDGAPPVQKDIVVYPKDRPLCNLSYMSANLDPMVYPLLFPSGDLGWVCGTLHAEPNRTRELNKVTLLQYYSYRLAIRSAFSPIHSAGKLFQQYLVDAYVKTEASRLDFIRRNQAKLRVELYQGLMDYVATQSLERGLPPGKVVVLPSTYHGSPRAMQQNFQDAMAIVCKYGKPDIFLTFTCNPKLPEITENLSHYEHSQDRPDLVARVFKLHLDALLKDITVNHILGVPVAYIHVIEFQKRGLPHAHLLIILNQLSKLRTPDDIDNLICAEIPDSTTDVQLFNVVQSCMVHGPCGSLNPNAPCMQDGACSKGYPKEFCPDTVAVQNGYPLYRRRDNGSSVAVRGHSVDNRWVVPYNAYLCKKYQAHINVEACMSIKSVKYLFKYVYKGHDCANVEIRTFDHDEISTFLDARYVSAPEAFWRLSEYRMHSQSHTVVRLPVHLPDQSPVYFHKGKEVEAFLE